MKQVVPTTLVMSTPENSNVLRGTDLDTTRMVKRQINKTETVIVLVTEVSIWDQIILAKLRVQS
jgi:hypothetical protein